MKAVQALEIFELDYWAALAIQHPVRIAKAPSGEHLVCWSAEGTQMYSPSTRWRQASKFLLLMAREGRVVVSGGSESGSKAQVNFYPKGYEESSLIDTYAATHETHLSVALIRCFLQWKFGAYVQDVQIN